MTAKHLDKLTYVRPSSILCKKISDAQKQQIYRISLHAQIPSGVQLHHLIQHIQIEDKFGDLLFATFPPSLFQSEAILLREKTLQLNPSYWISTNPSKHYKKKDELHHPSAIHLGVHEYNPSKSSVKAHHFRRERLWTFYKDVNMNFFFSIWPIWKSISEFLIFKFPFTCEQMKPTKQLPFPGDGIFSNASLSISPTAIHHDNNAFITACFYASNNENSSLVFPQLNLRIPVYSGSMIVSRGNLLHWGEGVSSTTPRICMSLYSKPYMRKEGTFRIAEATAGYLKMISKINW